MTQNTISRLFLGLATLLFKLSAASATTLLASSYTTGNILEFDAATGAYQGEFVSAASSGGLAQPQGFVFGSDGKFYVSSFGTSQIKRYDASTGAFIDNFASTASGSRGLAFDANGLLYAAYGSSVARYDSSGNIDAAFTHTFAATATGVIKGVDNDIYVSWGSNSVLGGIARYDTVNNTWNDAWRTDSAGQAWYITQDASGTLYLGSSGTTQVFRDDGTTLVPFISGITDLDRPRGLTFGPDGNLYVGGFGGVSRSNILHFNGTTGAYLGTFATGGGLDQPFFLGIAPSAVPLPAAAWLFGSALAGLGVFGRRKKPVEA